MRFPLLVFLVVAALLVGYAVFAADTTSETLAGFRRLEAERIADLVERIAVNNRAIVGRALRKREQADQFVLDAIQAGVKHGDLVRRRERSSLLAVIQAYVRDLNIDRVYLIDSGGRVVLDVGKPRRPGKSRPSPHDLMESRTVVQTATRIARGEPAPADPADPLKALGTRVLYRAIGRGFCIALVRDETAPDLGIGDLFERFQGDPTIAFLELRDRDGQIIARAEGRPSNGPIARETRTVDVGGRGHTLDVGIARLEEAAALERRARLAPFVIGGSLLVAGAVALAFLFRRQAAFVRREKELIVQAERDRRLAALGRLTAGVAHEIKNPLNTIRLSVGRLRRRLGDESTPILDAVDAAVGSVTRTVEDFMKLARDPGLAPAPGALADIVAEALAQVEPMAAEKSIAVRSCLPPQARANYDRARFREALVNLLRNAIQAAKGNVEVGLRTDGDAFCIDIDDDGPGVPADRRGEILEFFFTTKADGTGLGLPLAHRVAEEHEGSLLIGTSPLGGARFTLTLPCL